MTHVPDSTVESFILTLNKYLDLIFLISCIAVEAANSVLSGKGKAHL